MGFITLASTYLKFYNWVTLILLYVGILYILNTVLCTCWILNSWQLFLNPVASLFWCGKCHPWGIQIKMSWDICNVCLSVGKKNISWVTSIWKSNNIICTVNSQVKYKYCQISIFGIKMMVKIDVIFMSFSKFYTCFALENNSHNFLQCFLYLVQIFA